MSIVKMSEFDLLLLNEHVDDTLKALQIYKNIFFKDIAIDLKKAAQNKEKSNSFSKKKKQTINEDNLKSAPDNNTEETPDNEPEFFKNYQNDYDFERNRFIQERLKEVLDAVDVFEKKHRKNKKHSKGTFFDKFNVINITFEELIERCEHINIEKILETYDQYYYSEKQLWDGYDFHRLWKGKTISHKELISLREQKLIIGTVAQAKAKNFETDLKECGYILFLSRPIANDQCIFIILPPEDYLYQIEILLDKYRFKLQSAKSLEITEDVKKLTNYFDSLIERHKTIDERLANIGEYRQEIQLYYEYLRNEELRYATKSKFLVSQDVTRLSGWFFTEETKQLTGVLEKTTNGAYFLETEETHIKSKEVPIQLRNNKLNRPFQDLTTMYSLPRYSEIDPTSCFTPFYAIFFGMMLGDVGYGIIMGLFAIFCLKKLNLKESSQLFAKFLLFLSVPTIICGWVYSSFMGGIIPIPGLIDINKDFMKVLIFSICFGVFHIFFGLGVKAYLYFKNKQPWSALFDVGFWYMTLIGGGVLSSLMFTPLLAGYKKPALILMILGMVGIFLTNGRHAKTIFGKAVTGLHSLYGLSGYISDVLSYSRLMALGLAGASIGFAFNKIVGMVSKHGVFGIFCGVIIFMIGHTFNLGMSGLSAYVHSARLTYVEFFSKFYTGGGQKFEEFRSKSTYINIQ